MVHPYSLRIPRVRRYSGYCSLLFRFHLRGSHTLRRAFPCASVNSRIRLAVRTPEILLPPVWPLPLSLATTRGISFDFSSSGYLDVSVPRVPSVRLCIYRTVLSSSDKWLPNSEICGSMLIYSSPQLIAVSHVLLRLLTPRHSPCALFSLNFPKRKLLLPFSVLSWSFT